MNVLRVSFLVVVDALAIVMLVSVLAACVSTPVRYRNGDFVSNIASTESVARDRPAPRPIAAPEEAPSRSG